MERSTGLVRLCAIIAAGLLLAACSGGAPGTTQIPQTLLAARINRSNSLRGPLHTQWTRYLIEDIGTLGGSFSEAVGVNSRGGISGYSAVPGDSIIHAFYWSAGVMTDLGTLGGPNSFAPEWGSPNERGEVAGMSDTAIADPYSDNFCGFFDFEASSPNICSAFVWRNGSMTELPTLGGPNSVALAVNDRGAVLGISETATQNYTCIPGFAFGVEGVVWGPENRKITGLAPLAGDDFSFSGAINDKGEAAGGSGTCAGAGEAVLWRSGTPINLGTLGGVAFNGAFGINEQSEVVGQSNLKGDQAHHAFLWRKGRISDLGSILHLPDSLAAGINNLTQIVGFSQDQNGNNTTAWVWQDGVMTDLNTLIPAGSPWFIMETFQINDRGQIVGYGYNSQIGQVHAILLTPCSEANDHRLCHKTRARTSSRVAPPQAVQSILERLNRLNRVGLWPVR